VVLKTTGAIVATSGAALAIVSTFLPVVTLTSIEPDCLDQCFGTQTVTWWGFSENLLAPQGGADFVSMQAGWVLLACGLTIAWGVVALMRKPNALLCSLGIGAAFLATIAVIVQFLALSTFTHFWVPTPHGGGWNRVSFGPGRPLMLVGLGSVIAGVAMCVVAAVRPDTVSADSETGNAARQEAPASR